MSNLTPTSIVDKNGKATTVHKNLASSGSKGGNRLNKVAAVPNKFPTRQVRSIINESNARYHNWSDAQKSKAVSNKLKDIMGILDGSQQYFGKPSEAIAHSLGTFAGAQERDMAERIVAAVGIPDEKLSSYPITESKRYYQRDVETVDIINGEAKFTIKAKAPEWGNPFDLSQVLNRKFNDELHGDNLEEETLLGSFYDFKYMGASEYEFGAISKSRKLLLEAHELQYGVTSIEIEGVKRDVHFIGANIGEPIAYLHSKLIDGELSISNRAGSGFSDTFVAGSTYGNNVGRTVWWALGEQGNFLYTLDEDRIEDVAKVLRRGAVDHTQLVKVNVDVV